MKNGDEVVSNVSEIVEHLKKNIKNYIIVDEIEEKLGSLLRAMSCTNFNTPIITHGMREYNQPMAKVLFSSGQQAFLRHSPEFEKQLVTLSTNRGYFQKAPCCRPGETGKFHLPYLHQLDVEFPFNCVETTHEQAAEETCSKMLKVIIETFRAVGLPIDEVFTFSYDCVLDKYGTDNPYIDCGESRTSLLVVKNPPLFKKRKDGSLNTFILPMAQPIWRNAEHERLFIEGGIEGTELFDLRVYGYDFILSSPYMYEENEASEGLEIAGGSSRISSPDLQFKILKMTRLEHIETFSPMVALLKLFEYTGRYSAGGAIGLERMALAASRNKHISCVQTIPWDVSGVPPFLNND